MPQAGVAFGVQCDNLFLEARQPPLMRADELRLKRDLSSPVKLSPKNAYPNGTAGKTPIDQITASDTGAPQRQEPRSPRGLMNTWPNRRQSLKRGGSWMDIPATTSISPRADNRRFPG